jgi:hypothetical protein
MTSSLFLSAGINFSANSRSFTNINKLERPRYRCPFTAYCWWSTRPSVWTMVMAVSARTTDQDQESSSFWAVRVLTRIQTKREGPYFSAPTHGLVFLPKLYLLRYIYIYMSLHSTVFDFYGNLGVSPMHTFHQCIHDSFGLKCNIRQLLYFPCLASQPSWSTERLRSRNRRHMWHPAEVLKAHPPSGHTTSSCRDLICLLVDSISCESIGCGITKSAWWLVLVPEPR